MEKLAVSPKDAFAALGIGTTKGYELINSGQLEIIKIGRATRVKTSSIRRLVGEEAKAA